MKAIVTQAPFRMEVTEKAVRTPGDTEAVVRITAAGVCAGDMHIYKGLSHYAVFPIVAGHEIAGIVEQVEPGDHGLRQGDSVVIDPFVPCGHCYACRAGKPNCCACLHIYGVHQDGGFAEFITVPAANLYRIPEGLAPEVAVFAEPVAIGVHACHRAAVSQGETVCVLGCGPIGMVTIEVALTRGARVLATDINRSRLTAAADLGAEILVSGPAFKERLLALTDNEGPGVVMEATGVPEIMELAIDIVPPGGRVVILGLTAGDAKVSFPGIDFTRKELTLLGSRTNLHDFPEALALLASGKLAFPALARQFSLWEAPQVFDALNKEPWLCHKAVLINKG